MVSVYERGGKTPCSAMMNTRVKYGCILLCERLPPVSDVENGDILTLLVEAYSGGGVLVPPSTDQTAFAGEGMVAPDVSAFAVCV